MNTRNVLNIGLAISLAILIAIVVYDPGKEITISKISLTPLKQADIKQLIIEQSLSGLTSNKIVLTKKNDQWQMDMPYNNLANTLRINKLLALSQAKSHAQYPAANINLKQLKLFQPDLIIRFNNTKLLFGTTDALRGYRYIQVNNTVHLITDRYSHLVRGQASRLLSPALLPKNTAIIKLILPNLTLQKNNAGWKTNPDNKSTSADQLQQLIDEWRFARALSVNKTTIKANDKNSNIEIHNDKNQRILFNLIHEKNEMILLRLDTGLRYHFSTEAGERLLKPQLSKTSSN